MSESSSRSEISEDGDEPSDAHPKKIAPRADLPFDDDGDACCTVLIFTARGLQNLLTSLRNATLLRIQQDWTNRKMKVEKFSRNHVRQSLHDLEERLRLHGA